MHLLRAPLLLTLALTVPALQPRLLASPPHHLGTLGALACLAALWMLASLLLVGGWALAGRILSRPGV